MHPIVNEKNRLIYVFHLLDLISAAPELPACAPATNSLCYTQPPGGRRI